MARKALRKRYIYAAKRNGDYITWALTRHGRVALQG